MMNGLAQITVATLALAVSGSAQAAPALPPDPITKPANLVMPYTTRGYMLEANLGKMIADCKVGPLNVSWRAGLGKKTKEISAVPANLRSKIGDSDLTTTLKVLGDGNLTNIFTTVWSTSSLDTATQVGQNLPLRRNLADDQMLLEPDLSGVRYGTSCAKIISGALSTSGEWDIGVGALKAGLESSFESSTQSRIDLLMGTFRSPILMAYDGELGSSNPAGEKFAAAMLMWQWYETNPDSSGYLLEKFKGDALYRRYGYNTEVGGAVRLDARLGGFGAAANATTAASIRTDETLNGETFAVAVERTSTTLDANMRPLPTPAQAAEVAKRNANFQRGLTDSAPIIRAGLERTVQHRLTDLPRNFCFPGGWTSTVPIQAAEAIDARDPAKRFVTCQFTFSYRTTAADVENGVTIQPEITRAIGGGANTLKLIAEPVQISGGKVAVRKQSVTPKPVITDAGNGQSKLSWTTVWQVSTTLALQASDPITAVEGVLNCSSIQDFNQPSFELGSLQGTTIKTFRITWSSLIPVSVTDVSGRTGSVTCTLNPSLTVRTTSGDVPISLDEAALTYPVPAT